MNALDRVDLSAVARTEIQRRHAAWTAELGAAPDRGTWDRIREMANADYLIWRDIVLFIEQRWMPEDESRTMARMARRTLQVARESDGATAEQRRDLYALTRHLEIHAQHRHGRDWDKPAIERKAA